MNGRVYDTVFGMVRRGDMRPDGFRFVGLYNGGEEKWASPRAWRTHLRALKNFNETRVAAIKKDPGWRRRLTKELQKFRRKNPALCLLYAARARAKAQGVPCTITVSDIQIPKFCPALGIPLRSRMGTGQAPGSNSPAIDKILPRLGYIPGNVVVVSQLANLIKTNATIDQILKVGRFYQKLTEAL